MRHVVKTAAVLVATVAMVSGTLITASATTTSFVAEADAFVVSSTPTANRGNSTSLKVNDDLKRSYLRFDVSGLPSGESVTDATLKVFTTSGPKCSQGAEVLRASNDTWNESAITWTISPAPPAHL